MLQDGAKWSRLLVRLLQYFNRLVVCFTKVSNLARVLGEHIGILAPDTLLFVFDFVLLGKKLVVQASFNSVASSFSDFSKGARH